MNISSQDGKISIRQWGGDHIQITNNKSIKGPSTKEKLREMLDSYELKKDSSIYSINIDLVPDEAQKPLYRMKDDIDILVPESIKYINVEAENGDIELLELENLHELDIYVEQGRISIYDCSSKNTNLNVSTGNISVDGSEGTYNTYECGRGVMELRNISGTTQIDLTSGNIYIVKLDGKLNGTISTGDIVISDSDLEKGSSVYVSYGSITADLSGIEDTGTYSIKAANGNVKLSLPENKGWSVIAKAEKGRIVNNVKDNDDSLKTAPTGEVYGDVAGGGANVDAYVYKGSIYLN
jgi:DUF4097 and DUF4098 domain-containing protein YvlB